MKEASCICGERIVFLDPEVVVKTCPNCGNSVYQHGMAAAVEDIFRPTRKRSVARRSTRFLLGVIAVVLGLASVFFSVSAVRRSAFRHAGSDVSQGDQAMQRGDYNSALAAYTRALTTYKSWFAGAAIAAPVEAALSNVRYKLAHSASLPDEGADGPALLPISLEDVARQAYDSSPEAWQQTFDAQCAGRMVVIRGNVQRRSGTAYKATALTLSYRVFSPAGKQVEISFDSPFFERYRFKEGDDCIVAAVLSKMYLDPGAPGESGHWVLVVDGAASSLVNDAGLLRGLGWNVDDEVENILASQRLLSPAY